MPFRSYYRGELGIGEVVIQTMTGHLSLGMLQKYFHCGLDNKKRSKDALTDYVLNADKGPVSLSGQELFLEETVSYLYTNSIALQCLNL
jgi:hypothetical protein